MSKSKIKWRSDGPGPYTAKYRGYEVSVEPGHKGWYVSTSDPSIGSLATPHEWGSTQEAMDAAAGVVDRWIEAREKREFLAELNALAKASDDRQQD